MSRVSNSTDSLNIIDAVQHVFSGKLQTAFSSVKGKTGELIDSVRKWILNQIDASQLHDDVVTLVSILSELDVPENAQFISSLATDAADYISECSIDTANQFIDTFDRIISKYNPAEEAKLVISDASGYCYTFVRSRFYSELGVLGIATSYAPEDLSDFLIYIDQSGKAYINWAVKSLGFTRSMDYSVPTTAFAICEGIMDLLDLATPQSDVLGMLNATEEHFDLQRSNTITDAISNLLLHFNLTTTGSIMPDLTTLWEHIDESYGVQDFGIKRFFCDIIRDLSTSSTIVAVLEAFLDLAQSGLFTVSDFKARVDAFVSKASDSVRKLVDDICNAYVKAQLYGVYAYLSQFIANYRTLASNGNVLVFADNSSLVPQQYVATAVITVISAVANVAAAVIAIAFKGIGLVLFAASQLVNIAGQFIANYQQSSVSPQVIFSDYLSLPCGPFAFYQAEIDPADYGFASSMLTAIKNCGSCLYADVPGGIIICGLNEDQDRLRFEFHPSAICFSEEDYQEYFDGTLWNYRTTESQGFLYRIFPGFFRYTAHLIENNWVDVCRDKGYMPSNIDGKNYVSDETSNYLLMSQFRNLAIFTFWLRALSLDYDALPPGYTGYDVNSWLMVGIKSNDLIFPYGLGAFALTNPAWTTYDMSQFLNITRTELLWPDSQPGNNYVTWTALAKAAVNSGNSFKLLHLPVPDAAPAYGSEFTAFTAQFANQYWEENLWYGAMASVPSKFNFYFSSPQFEGATYWLWAFVAVATTVVTVAVAAVVALRVRKLIQTRRAKLAAKTLNAWETYSKSLKEYDSHDPQDRPEYHTDEARAKAYNAYRKTAFSANVWSSVFGGTKYSYNGYWADANSSSFYDTVKDGYYSGTATGEYDESSDAAGSVDTSRLPDNYPSLLTIKKLITG